MSDKRHEWISIRARQLWEESGCPEGHDLAFWLAAENEHDRCEKGRLCILSPHNCPYQATQPTTSGRHVSVCTRCDGHCRNRATNYITVGLLPNARHRPDLYAHSRVHKIKYPDWLD